MAFQIEKRFVKYIPSHVARSQGQSNVNLSFFTGTDHFYSTEIGSESALMECDITIGSMLLYVRLNAAVACYR